MDGFQIQLPNLSAITAVPYNPVADSFADTQFEIIRKYILDFQRNLDQEHDVGLMLTNFGQSIVMQVTDIGYEEPVLMVFRGYVNGQMATLIQHVSQLNFLLTTVSKDPAEPKRTIGFTVTPAGK
ncbi:MAG TPA: hypothetical protein H9787_11745 [Candidatus Oscillibacter excrementigallinarum]|uniref:Uncharacterized protein n=1 Tax=Candidatus Oscillibacter excrementigallinarum TaxID=2838716 RepID=A0A9D2LKU0_9FIRM|nr:hypothetical protein [Candidatus Oscillibacter excrementigallinarum]